ncbi:MAG TPA: TAT-variant-translocated molybdopterin oxidoreductase, partial [Fimbriimonadaceae bacterium]|nr:TAT-variant-translocated molybdopterin oxidoreductase [Fimbriimonadaceae bacterium]
METTDKKGLDLDAVRQKLEGTGGAQYWRSLEELAETDEFKQWLDDEFPHRSSIPEIDRRSFLKFVGASLALAGLAGCRNMPQERIVPHVRAPEERKPGEAIDYATAMPFNGYGLGLLVESHEGRPTKIEGNPQHPASLGATDIYAQAEILTMYDPDR